MKLFLDANILFTAAYSPRGLSRAILDSAEALSCPLFTSGYALEEARRNLALKAPAKVPELDIIIPRLVIIPEPSPEQVRRAIKLPLALKDAPVMAAAAACGADILITGDRRDFGHLFGEIVEGVRVLPPREALDMILKRQV